MITITGSLAFDHIMDFPGKFSEHIMPDKIHQINLSFLVNSLQKQKGGNAGNIAYNLALLKMPVSILGAVGNDFSNYADFLKEIGVDITNIKIIPNEPTSSAFITTDLSDNQLAAFYPGAMKQVHTLKIGSFPTKPNFVVISPTTPRAMTNFTAECKQLNIPYMFDPGMILPRLNQEQIKLGVKGAEILIGNDYEIALLSEKIKVKTFDKAQVRREKLLEQVKILIITKGEKGSQIQTSNNNYTINSAQPNKVVDPTGAGDAYRAGFLAGFIKKFDLKTCGQMGSMAACYAVEKYGTTNHKFTIGEFCKRYRENFGEELKLS